MSLGIASSGGGIDGLRKKSAKDGPCGSGRRCGSAVDFCLLRKRRRLARKRSSMVAEGLEARWPSAAFCDARRRRRSLRVKCVYFALLSARVSHRCEWQRLVMAKSSRQVDIQFCPSRTRPGTGPRTTVRTRRRGERRIETAKPARSSCSTLCQCAAEQAWGAVARRDADARRRIVQRRIAARESGSPFALAHSPT